MAIQTKPTVFVRNATGLRKEAGALDVFVYNTNNQNIGLGVAFLVLSVGAYAGGLLPLSAILATVLVVPLYMVYSKLSADMPRSGGDYVWTSRIFGPVFGPPIGFMVAWTWIILAFTAIGAPAAFFTQLGIAPWMRSLGVVSGSSTFMSFGNWASGETGSIVIGTVLLLFFTAILILGVRTYMRIQNWAFLLAMIGIVLQVIAGLVSRSGTFGKHFDSYVSKAGGLAHASSTVAKSIPVHHGISASATFYAMLWTIYMVLFGATSCYIGGEVRRAKSTQRIGMIGSLLLTGGIMAFLLWELGHFIGTPFLNGLSSTDPSTIGLGFAPTYNELLTAGAGGGAFWAIALGLTFLFWTYVWMPINFFTSTRLMLALSLDGYLPRSVSKVHEKYATPWVAVIIAFVFGEASLIFYVNGTLSVITLLWGGALMFAVVGVAAILYPSRMRETWVGNGGRKFMGVPAISIWGALLVPAMIVVLYILWKDPVVGIGASTKQTVLNIGLPVSGLVVYFVIWAWRKRGGVDLRLAAAEIPPE